MIRFLQHQRIFLCALVACSFVPMVTIADDIGVNIVVADTACTDNIDNDGDLLIDFPDDPGCADAFDTDEADPPLVQCNDTIDNDGDLLIDFPADLGCDSATDDNETNPSSGGGGGGGSSSGDANVTYAGVTIPFSEVTVLLDGVIVATTTSDQAGAFFSEIPDVDTGTHTFAFYSYDSNSVQTDVQSVTFKIKKNQDVLLDDIFIPPTILLNKSEVARTSTIVVSVETIPLAEVYIEVHSQHILSAITNASSKGSYSYEFTVVGLDDGEHTAYAYVLAADGSQSQQVTSNTFIIGDTDIAPTNTCLRKGDLNNDCKTEFTDFSIMLYWWDREFTEEFRQLEATRLSNDGRLSIVDLSVMVFYWNGPLVQ